MRRLLSTFLVAGRPNTDGMVFPERALGRKSGRIILCWVTTTLVFFCVVAQSHDSCLSMGHLHGSLSGVMYLVDEFRHESRCVGLAVLHGFSTSVLDSSFHSYINEFKHDGDEKIFSYL